MKFIITLIIFLITLINSRFLNLFWVDLWFYVNWNYEFTKVIFTNISLWFLSIYFFLKNYNKKIIVNKYIFILLFLFFISLVTSSFPLTNIFWSNLKWHWLILFTSLLAFYIILINIKKNISDKIIHSTILLSIFPLLIAIKEFLLPSNDYWELANRAIWTFGHPNYLALYILILIPFLLNNLKKNFSYYIIFLFAVFVLFLTKSLFWISIFIIYISYYLIKIFKINKKNVFFISTIFIIILSLIIYKFWLVTKLNSFVSRFYIWETTLYIIFSNIKYIIFWLWNDSLFYLFDSYKSTYLYIYENIGFSADRTHNFFLQIFYNYWLLWVSVLWIFLLKFLKIFKNKEVFHTILLFLLFTIFNFSSVIVYLLLLVFIANISKRNLQKKYHYLLKIFLMFFSLFSIITSSFYYYFEYMESNWVWEKNIYYQKIINENIEKNIFSQNLLHYELCEKLTSEVNSVENYFYCWNILWEIDQDLAKKYYKQWLNILPNLWKPESKYNKEFLVKILLSENRFYSEKYSNLQEILNRVWIEK